MADYIDLEAAKVFFMNMDAGRRCPCSTLLTPEEFTEYLDEIPTADVAPVVHGRWIVPIPPDNYTYCKCVCSVCNHTAGKHKTPYCPACGAKMDGGAENG